jgi:hypothetical protein
MKLSAKKVSIELKSSAQKRLSYCAALKTPDNDAGDK